MLSNIVHIKVKYSFRVTKIQNTKFFYVISLLDFVWFVAIAFPDMGWLSNLVVKKSSSIR